MKKRPEPQPPQDVEGSRGVDVIYNGRHFYGSYGSDRAELTYLRDWKQWAEKEMGRENKI